jgi:hypothetical protein
MSTSSAKKTKEKTPKRRFFLKMNGTVYIFSGDFCFFSILRQLRKP